MAQLVLTTASRAASSFGAAFASSAASTLSGLAANTVSSLIFGPTRRRREGPRLDSFTVQASTEGAAILKVYGRARLGGQIIWAANFRETLSEETQGSKGSRLGTQTTTATYLYSISVAIGLCEGEIARIGRVWADGKPFDLSTVNARLYQGTDDQLPDSVIEAVEGPGNAPAFRDLAYIVFEDLPLGQFGNRIPQFSFEVEKPLTDNDPLALENQITSLTIIPATGEFVYGTSPVTRTLGPGVHINENIHHNNGGTDFTAAMDAAQGTLNNWRCASLVISWFGTSTNASNCELVPGVETRDKQTTPYEWSVNGFTREDGYLISQNNGSANFGGTPSDICVLEALADFAERGIKVMIHPFILMDIPPESGQAPFPWRGRISAQAADGTPAASNAVDAFFGAATPGDFSINGQSIQYAGQQNDRGFRRFILHHAWLAKLANQLHPGSVDSFLLGSEMRGITTIRDQHGGYPAIVKWQELAADVRTVLGADVEISYGADWSEYSGHQPGDGSGTRAFHLDPLWADPAIDFIGIDYYMPLADWRDGQTHLDALENDSNAPHDIAYLQNNIRGGEGYDWFYANQQDRDAQIRTPIIDSAHNEHWVFRVKDLWNWWSNPHHDRPNGARAQQPTDWIPRSKPIRFTELGCPAIDRGSNQPNVFVDPGSSESTEPFYSRGTRDDLAQRALLEAHASYWQNPANNPSSDLYEGTMVDADRHYIYAFDARPFPAFPARSDIWSDGENWTLGHWLNGRIGRAPLDRLVECLSQESGPVSVDTTRLEGIITGYIIDRPMSARDMISPLADIFQFDAIESAGTIRFQPRFDLERFTTQIMTLDAHDLVAIPQSDDNDEGGSPFQVIMGQADDLPSTFRLGFLDEAQDITPAIATARDPALTSAREDGTELPIIINQAEADARARTILADAWVMREQIRFAVSPSLLALEPGDLVTLTVDDNDRLWRITNIEDGNIREIDAVRLTPSVYDAPTALTVFDSTESLPAARGPIDWVVMDLPWLGTNDREGAPWFAAYGRPWPGGAHLVQTNSGQAASLATAQSPIAIGRLIEDMPVSYPGRLVETSVHVRLDDAILTDSPASRETETVLAGANSVALETPDGGYEIAQFRSATLIAPGEWKLTGWLRGQAGTDRRPPPSAGARMVFLAGATFYGGTTPLSVAQGPFDIPLSVSAGPIDRDPADETYTEGLIVMGRENLSPLSPVHLRAASGDNGTHLSWTRRTRIQGDDWSGEDVPLGEAFERYRIEFRNGDNIVRTTQSDQPSFFYTNEMMASDQTALGAGETIAVRVAQLSDHVGIGHWSQDIAVL